MEVAGGSPLCPSCCLMLLITQLMQPWTDKNPVSLLMHFRATSGWAKKLLSWLAPDGVARWVCYFSIWSAVITVLVLGDIEIKWKMDGTYIVRSRAKQVTWLSDSLMTTWSIWWTTVVQLVPIPMSQYYYIKNTLSDKHIEKNSGFCLTFLSVLNLECWVAVGIKLLLKWLGFRGSWPVAPPRGQELDATVQSELGPRPPCGSLGNTEWLKGWSGWATV